MSIFFNVVPIIFWGFLLFVVLVVVHEFGHFFAARVVGCRVTEFFVGFPCRFKIARRSKKLGTEFGITPLLFGGYNRICGMEPINDEHSKRVFAYVLRHGTVCIDDVARGCNMSEEDTRDALGVLVEWAAIEPGPDEENGKKSEHASESSFFRTVDRDDAFLTRYDRGNTLGAGAAVAYPAGSVQPCDDADACYEAERAHVYRGKGFFARMFVVIMGAFVNVFVGMALIISALVLHGEVIASSSNIAVTVVPQSCAAKAGLQDGDVLVRVDGKDTPSWHELADQVGKVIKKGTPFTVVYERSGVRGEATVHPDGASHFGIENSKRVFFSFDEAVRASCSYFARVIQVYGRLCNPAHTAEVVDQSSSFIGISVMASKMVAIGLFPLIKFAAVISVSLGIMNLLPLLPLDGGRVVVETVQTIFRREIPVKILNVLTYVGFALLLLLFIFVVRADIFRWMVG